MVLKKRLDYGFNGFQPPFIPRAPRSHRRRDPYKKLAQDNQNCAFELLASLAGKLLQESESSAASSNASPENDEFAFGKGVDPERQIEVKTLKGECIYPGSCEEAFVGEVASQNITQKCTQLAGSDAVMECTSVIKNSEGSERIIADVKSVNCKWDNPIGDYSSRVTEYPQDFGEACDGNLENQFRLNQDAEGLGTGGSTSGNKCIVKDTVKSSLKSSSLLVSDSIVKYPFPKESIPNASFSKHGNDNKLGFRDDDDNFSRCKKCSTKLKPFRPPQRIANQRIRNLLSSKYWKAAPKLKDFELSRPDMALKPLQRKRKSWYNFERCQHDTLFKRRRFFDRSSLVKSDGGFSSESVSNSPQKGMNEDKCGSSTILHAVSGSTSSVFSRQASFHSQDSHVKFSIKSFRVPEVYVEVPENATVGLLKRTVMEAVTSILGAELHVGVVLQGKKIRDDNRTLLQTGISSKENLETIGFTLEPSSIQSSPPVCSGDPSPVSPCETSQPLVKTLGNPVLDSGANDAIHDCSLLTNVANHVESNNEQISSRIDTVEDEITPDSRALVAVPTSTEALSATPVSQKSRRSELVQRRTRRPFSVFEVEALVQAVEELGTGRWRDVKLRAFENADHRTYVDLKDKWKTLVHTASISPQQRRGEPVPQELLDRVLAAHAHWSQNQAKQHGKHQAGSVKMIEASTERLVAEGTQPIVMM